MSRIPRNIFIIYHVLNPLPTNVTKKQKVLKRQVIVANGIILSNRMMTVSHGGCMILIIYLKKKNTEGEGVP